MPGSSPLFTVDRYERKNFFCGHETRPRLHAEALLRAGTDT